MKIQKECVYCGGAFETTQYRLSLGRGLYCSTQCRYEDPNRKKEISLKRFIAKHRRTPQELESFLNENEITLTEYSRLSSIPVGTLSRELKFFGVTPYKMAKKCMRTYRCNYCAKSFEGWDRPSRTNRNSYCSVECAKNARRGTFDEKRFEITNYQFGIPGQSLGDYQYIELGKRQKSFVNRDKVNHFFFQKGIVDEKTAYVFGVLLTDGSIYRDKKGSYCIRLQMTDLDIVEKISSILQNKNPLMTNRSRRTLTLSIASPYLFNDLDALGCGPNKTEFANYPLIPANLHQHLIRGIVDGDGSWAIRKDGSISLQICGNDLLMYGVYKRISHHLCFSPQSVQYPIEFDKRIKEVFSKFISDTISCLYGYKRSQYIGPHRSFEKTSR